MSVKKARIAWIGLSDVSEQLKLLAWKTEKAARKMGFKEENRFHPHITFARLKFPSDVTGFIDSTKEKAQKLDTLPIKIEKVTLFESKLNQSGAKYSVLKDYLLKI